jgi:hypothetical protein
MQDPRVHIAKLSSSHAPIASLPIELLTAIFKSGPSDAWERVEYAISISQVSRCWRNVSLATGSMWSLVRVVPYESSEQLRIVETFIERSRFDPLDIVIDTTSNWTERDDIVDELSPQLDLVVSCVSRWRTLVIRGSFWEDISDVCGPFDMLCAPLLESLDVEINSEEDNDEYIHRNLRIFTGGAPKLSYVRVQGPPLTSCLPPLESLISLDLHSQPKPLTLAQYRHTLTASDHLRNLRITSNVADNWFFYRGSSNSPPVAIPSLHSLVLEVIGFGKIGPYSFIAGLECPALEHLTIVSIFARDMTLPALAEAVRETDGPSRYPLLQSLTLRYVTFSEWWHANWLGIMLPSLARVVLDSCENSAVMLEQLLPLELRFPKDDLLSDDEGDDEPSSVHWPLLKTLGISRIGPEEFEPLSKLISDRISRGTPLVCIQHRSAAITKDNLEWLQARVHVEEVKSF